MMPASQTSDATRLCGHKDAYTFERSRSSKETMMQTAEARATICAACTERLIAWLATNETRPYPVALPELKGTPRMISWARSIRAQVQQKYFPVMQTLSEQRNDPLACAALAAYTLLFTIDSAKFWITNSVFKYDRWWVSSEISILALGRVSYGKKVASYSACGHYLVWAPQLVAAARQQIQWREGTAPLSVASGL